MARLRYNGLTATLGAALAAGGTTITFAAALTHSGGTAVPTITGTDYIPLAILTSAGAVSEIVYLTAYTTGATTGTITRGQESTTGSAHSAGDGIIHGPTVEDMNRGVLTTTNYNPATLAVYTTTSTTAADMDSTNLAATFTVPASGRVNVTLSGLGRIEGANANLIWLLRDSGGDVAGTEAQVSSLNTTGNIHFTFMIPLSGLTPGASKTLKWGWRTAGTGTATMYAGGIAGPTVMEVIAA